MAVVPESPLCAIVAIFQEPNRTGSKRPHGFLCLDKTENPDMTLTLDTSLARKYVDAGDLEAGTARALQLYREFLHDDALYGNVNGWVDPASAAVQLPEIREKAAEIRERADLFVLVGVGGSNQAARAMEKALSKPDAPRFLYAGNTLSADSLRRIAAELESGNVYVNVIAKNFATLEPGSHHRVIRTALARRYNAQEMAERFILTGTAGSLFESIAVKNGNLFLQFPVPVGGRFSAFTPVGLFPMAVAGLDVDELLRGVGDMAETMRGGGEAASAAAAYAVLRNLLLQKGYAVELFSVFEPRLAWFGKWWLQLFGESEGKIGKGLFPACAEYSEDLHAIGQYVQEGKRILIESFLSVGNSQASLIIPSDENDEFGYLNGVDFDAVNKAAESATIAAHDAGGVPCFRFAIDTIDEYHFGQLFYFYMTACTMSALFLGVNPFDQEGVEQYKARMFKLLGK